MPPMPARRHAGPGPLQRAGLAHLGPGGEPGERARILVIGSTGRALGRRQRRVQLLQHHAALFRGQLGERLGMRFFDRLRWSRSQEIPVAIDRLLVRRHLRANGAGTCAVRDLGSSPPNKRRSMSMGKLLRYAALAVAPASARRPEDESCSGRIGMVARSVKRCRFDRGGPRQKVVHASLRREVTVPSRLLDLSTDRLPTPDSPTGTPTRSCGLRTTSRRPRWRLLQGRRCPCCRTGSISRSSG